MKKMTWRGRGRKWFDWRREKEVNEAMKKKGKKRTVTQTDLEKYGLKVEKLTKKQTKELEKMEKGREALEKEAERLAERARRYRLQVDTLKEIGKERPLTKQEEMLLKKAESEVKKTRESLIRIVKDAL